MVVNGIAQSYKYLESKMKYYDYWYVLKDLKKRASVR